MKIKFFEKHFNVQINSNLESFTEVSTDTRTIKKGALFVALKGPNFDGNLYAAEAFKKGAVGALVSSSESLEVDSGVVTVENTLGAFQGLARAWQDKVRPKTIGITGSNGKTTSKFFTAQILEEFFRVCYSPKSFNNEVGVPFTQSLLKENDEILVAEIGTNAQGEIAELTKLVEPHIAVVTTVGPSHLEGFGTVENVALEKSDIYKSKNLKFAIFNLDNKWTHGMYKEMRKNFNGDCISFSALDADADVFVKSSQLSLDQLQLEGCVRGFEFQKTVKLFGKHNSYNIMTAFAMGLALGLSPDKLVESLPKINLPWGRSQIFTNPQGGKVLFDGYNSNLQSMEALLKGLEDLVVSGQKVHFILGEMLELGDSSDEMHQELGVLVGRLKPSSIAFLGPSFKHFKKGVESVKFSKSLILSDTYNDTLAIGVQDVLDPKDTVVIKGSRGMKLERFLGALGVKDSEI